MEQKSSIVTVKVQREAYDILVKHSEKVKRNLQYLLSRAIMRCYGNGKESQ